MNEDKKTVYCYDLHVNGLFGRNRKVKRESLNVVKHSETKLSLDVVIELAKKELERLKLKGNFALYEREGTIENDNGCEIYSTMLAFGAKPIWNGSQS